MAKLQFINGAITGKLGDFVGSKWKGAFYLKLHTVPKQPNTPDQLSIRKIFAKMSHFASALFRAGVLEYVYDKPNLTDCNLVFKANKSMFTNRVFNHSALQVAIPNLAATCLNISCDYFGRNYNTFMFGTNIVIPKDAEKTGLFAHVLVYDTVKSYVSLFHSEELIPNNNFVRHGQFTVINELDAPLDFNSPTGSKVSDCRCLFFVSRIIDGKKFISQTFSCPVTLGVFVDDD